MTSFLRGRAKTKAHMTASESQTKSFDFLTFTLQRGASRLSALLLFTRTGLFYEVLILSLSFSNVSIKRIHSETVLCLKHKQAVEVESMTHSVSPKNILERKPPLKVCYRFIFSICSQVVLKTWHKYSNWATVSWGSSLLWWKLWTFHQDTFKVNTSVLWGEFHHLKAELSVDCGGYSQGLYYKERVLFPGNMSAGSSSGWVTSWTEFRGFSVRRIRCEQPAWCNIRDILLSACDSPQRGTCSPVCLSLEGRLKPQSLQKEHCFSF